MIDLKILVLKNESTMVFCFELAELQNFNLKILSFFKF